MFHVRKVHCDEELYYFLYSICNLFSFGEIFSKNEFIYKELQFLFLTLGVGGILFTCITEIYYLEYFFVLLITMSLLNLWKERKKRRR